jgi:hypothetical protein
VFLRDNDVVAVRKAMQRAGSFEAGKLGSRMGVDALGVPRTEGA